jgi:hypothetical protein
MIPFQKDTYLVETRVRIFSPSPAICLDIRAKGGGHVVPSLMGPRNNKAHH